MVFERYPTSTPISPNIWTQTFLPMLPVPPPSGPMIPPILQVPPPQLVQPPPQQVLLQPPSKTSLTSHVICTEKGCKRDTLCKPPPAGDPFIYTLVRNNNTPTPCTHCTLLILTHCPLIPYPPVLLSFVLKQAPLNFACLTLPIPRSHPCSSSHNLSHYRPIPCA